MKASKQQIANLKKRAAPINYSKTSVDNMGNLKDRESLLDKRIVSGYGCIWGSRNDYGEIPIKGCCAKSISDLGPSSSSAYKIKFRDRHGNSCALMAKLQEDEIGLYFETEPLDEVQWCDDVLTQLRSGTLNNFSIGFKYLWDKIEYDEENDALVLLEIRLFEISVVDIPSDMETYAIRSAEEKELIIDETEEFIITLPKERQLQARKIFARYKSLNEIEPPEALDKPKPIKEGIDYSYLSQNLNF